ncbi:hypothetical protein M758_3G063100 [Ceratodon purpureus]|uniref:Uncharacterized protein n=1 Tax=Ceratodon purpureus TaxID=3225 RepID=A0A8T0IJ36_CERPU|nr:hypothetical protein KC19_3G063800 [Ceratodon purpureus]KAG0621976.1 hypothetical protein M758_3G063100 [Ceratodon purpureus]
MAATSSLQQIFSVTSSSYQNEKLFKCTGSATMGLSKGDVICVTDLGFSRSVNFGTLSALKTPIAVVGLGSSVRPLVRASVLAGPALEVVRVCVFYALVQTGVAVPSSILRGSADVADGASPQWLESLFGKDKEAEKDKEIIKLRRNWRTSTKGTLTRKYRVPSKSEGRKILNSICSLLSDDDDFVELGTHKGCAVRRENAHAETVCCNNVRACFDELPTPHLIVEITVFPKGPITDVHWQKAAKLEKVIKKGNSI